MIVHRLWTNAGLPELMAGGLDITNSRLAAILELFGIHIWNRGGQTSIFGNFNNAYGRVTVFGADSVRLEIVDEFGEVLASHTVLNGSLPSAVARRMTGTIARFTLAPNYPNPLHATASNSKTILRYSLPAPALVTATVYDLMGHSVRQLQKQNQMAGEHTLF